MRDDVVSTNEAEFIRAALREGVRVDGRRVNDARHVSVTVTSPGSAEVEWGRTRVVGVVKSEVRAPYPDRPTEGFFSVEVFLSKMGAPSFSSADTSEALQLDLERLLERTLRASKAVDTEALCIVAGAGVFSVTVCITVLDHSGNLRDAVQLAAIAALTSFRRPDVAVTGDKVELQDTFAHASVPLGVVHTPVSVTFALFDNPAVAVVDPTLREEMVMDGSITIALNNFGEICCITKPGGSAVSAGLLQQCIAMAQGHAARQLELLAAHVKSTTARPRIAGLQDRRAAPAPAPQPDAMES